VIFKTAALGMFLIFGFGQNVGKELPETTEAYKTNSFEIRV
jgi:hypothetical protein